MTKREPKLSHRPLRFEPLEARQLLSLTHWYTFNDGTAADLVGSYDLGLMNGAAIHSGQAVLLNEGVTSGQSSTVQYLNMNPNALPSGGSATIEVWFATATSASAWTRVFDIGNQVSGNGDSYLFYTPDTGGNESRLVLSDGGGAAGEEIAIGPATDDAFKHLISAVVEDAGSRSTLSLYLDGELVDTVAMGGADMGSITQSLAYFGRSLYNGDYGFTGMLDEIRIYDEALSASTIATHADEGPTLAASEYSITTLGADADTYIRDSTPRGSATVLDTMDWDGYGDWVTYVRFDLSGVDIDTITDAKLYLYKVPGTSNDTVVQDRFDVYGLANDTGNTPQNWNEATLDKDNVGAEYSSASGVNTSRLYNLDVESGADVAEFAQNGTYVGLQISGPDLVNFLNDRVDDDGLVTFVTIIDAGNIRGWGYASREHSEVTLRPSLVFQHSTVTPVPDPYPTNPTTYAHQMEDLDRGVVAVKNGSNVLVSWRMLGTDPADVAFNLYRKTGTSAPVKLNSTPITDSTNYVDAPNGTQTHRYFVRPIVDGIELGPVEPASIPDYATIEAFASSQYYHQVDINQPDSSYEANDASVGDLDGDGEYEIVLKWISSDAPIYLDAYKLDGTQLWRIDLGQNIRTGTGGFAATLPFIVYDLDGDGKAEVSMNTAPGTKDGLGSWVLEPGDDPLANYINLSGYAYTGPEYFSVFDGETGGLLANTDLGPARGVIEDYGDDYGHRATTFKAAIAYLDGVRPSVVIGRGIYHAYSGFSTAKTEMTAYNYRDDTLSEVWTFTANEGSPTGNENPTYVGQGNHNLSIGDLDGDGLDEVNWGAMAVDDDGTGLYSTGVGHGDAIHMSDMDPSNPGLELFKPNESSWEYADAGGIMYDAVTGAKLVKLPGGGDVGRGVASDIDPYSPGYEIWTSSHPDIYAVDGSALYTRPSNMFNNFLVWWDGDLTRELLDGTTISEWNNPGRSNFILDPQGGNQWAPGCDSNNGTKSTPALSGDILGDWREEVIWRTTDNQALRIFSTPIETDVRMVTLMHDRQYREAIAWQNVYYNQPPHPSFFLGAGMDAPPLPDVYVASANPPLVGDFDLDGDVDQTDRGIWQTNFGTSQSHGYLPGDADGNGTVTGSDFLLWQRHYGETAPVVVTVQATSDAPEVAPLAAEAESLDAAFAEAGFAGLPDTLLPSTPAESEESLLGEVPIESSLLEDIAATDMVFETTATEEESTECGMKRRDRETEQSQAVDHEFGSWDGLGGHDLAHSNPMRIHPMLRRHR